MAENPHTLVCFALKEEARPFFPLCASLPDVKILVTGMGRRNATESFLQALASNPPGLVLTGGFAGALNPTLPTGAVVFDVDAGGGLEAHLVQAGATRARFHCSERVAATAAAKRELFRTTGADVVEMESEPIRVLARQRGIPSATVRVVLDTASEDLPLDFNDLMTPDMRMDNRKLALAIARSPQVIPGLWAMQKQTRAAAARLAEVLRSVLALRAG